LPAGEVNARKAMLPVAAAGPEDWAKEFGPVCAKERRAESGEAAPKTNAMSPGVEDFFVESVV
jgi:hypothetical protein